MLATLRHNAAHDDHWAQNRANVDTGQSEGDLPIPVQILVLIDTDVADGVLYFLSAAGPSSGWSTVEFVKNLCLIFAGFGHQLFEPELLFEYLEHAACFLDFEFTVPWCSFDGAQCSIAVVFARSFIYM